jgi:uncharacterized protein (TIGR02328 family)
MFRGKRFQFGNYPGCPKTITKEELVAYHILVMNEMRNRHYKVNESWTNNLYRGLTSKPWTSIDDDRVNQLLKDHTLILPEVMTDDYKDACIQLIVRRGGELHYA